MCLPKTLETNKNPRFVDQEVSLLNLRQFGSHQYPGYLLDVAAAVANINNGILRLDEDGAAVPPS